MSFSITLKKNEEGKVEIVDLTGDQYCPDKLVISGHVENNGQTVDLTARATGITASASRRESAV